MRGFKERVSVEAALSWIDFHARRLDPEVVPLPGLFGRILDEQVISSLDVPGFPRAMMDGFAVMAADTAGAQPYNRYSLAVVGESLPGCGFAGRVLRGQAVRIMTGAPLPNGTDAVLPVEKVEFDDQRVLVEDEVTPGKHIACTGEDIQVGQVVLPSGRRLRPQDVGVLSSMGISKAVVVRQPIIRIVITGNELLPPGTSPKGWQIADANGPMLEALVRRDGGIPINPGIVPDEPDSLLAAMTDDVDVVLVSGGSSVGQEDYAPALLMQQGELAIHGIAMRPSSPAGLGRLGNRLVFLLPGNPVSCLCAYDFFAGPAIRILGGRGKQWPYKAVRLPLARKLVSVVGRVDYARVRLVNDTVEPLAISGASVLSSTSRADGFVVVPADSEGFPEGTQVQTWLYD
jgi:molybdopterin molybdotransferase